jgi:hypothetical protein
VRGFKVAVLKPPSALDVVRLIRRTREDTAAALIGYYQQLPRWSYSPARAMAKPVFSGEISLAAAIAGCLNGGNPLGRKWNAEVAELVWEAAQGRKFKCFDLSKRPFAIRQDLRFLVDPLFFFVEQNTVKIFWLQPRRGFNPTLEGLGTLATIVRMTYQDDFDDFDVEFLDLSRPSGAKKRLPRVYRFRDLPVLADTEVRLAMERFAQAYDPVCAMGVQRPERRARPSVDPEPRLFD